MIAFADAMPIQGFLGGLMIGLASALMLLGAGRLAGVSGLAARALGLAETGAPRVLSAAFILGLPLGAIIVVALTGSVVTRYPDSALILVAAGLAVGFGTRLGSGCTSGHGVCGVSRLSPRSLVATAVFMTTGFATVGLMNALGASW
jgi:uncharacterized membrane protein YedE/YeeE